MYRLGLGSSTAILSTPVSSTNKYLGFKVRLASICYVDRKSFMGFTINLSLCGGKSERNIDSL